MTTTMTTTTGPSRPRTTVAGAALAAAALLSACVAPRDYNDTVDKSAAYQQLQAQLDGAPDAKQAQLEQLQHLVRLTLSDALLFPEGGAQLSASGQALLAQLAPALKGLRDKRVVIKGFTDDVPAGPSQRERFAGNVELSKARCAAVSRFLDAQGVPHSIVYTSGLGETHPVADNDTPEGRALNRRVEIDIAEVPA